MMRIVLACIVLSLAAWPAGAQEFALKVPRGLTAPKVPADNAPTAAKVELGRQLYFDPRLSRDGTVSCATCHAPDKGWSNGAAFATGIGGQVGGRNSPTVINAAYFPLQIWDGRAAQLEGQALGPIQNPIEMNMTLPEVTARLNGIEGYRTQFQAVFGTDATPEGIARAIATFERTILSGDAPYDRYVAGDKTALTPAAERGFKLFFGKANCTACHAGPNFSDGGFHNLGVGITAAEPDVGRMAVTQQLGDRGAFKTPTLREIARTAPYMHDGSKKTLEEVVDFYSRGGVNNPQLDEEIFPLSLKPEEQADLVAFLKEGLSSANYPTVTAPELPK